MEDERNPFAVYKDGTWREELPPPKLTVLNFSGGRQSSALLWMVLLGHIPKPENLVVLNADPGMEGERVYRYVAMMRDKCRDAGIPFETAEGPNLYQDILNLKESGRTRLDNPPYWTKKASGKEGKLKQSCTRYYKIEPMDRAIRRILEERFSLSRKSGRLGDGIVEKWIGFSSSEVSRIKPPGQKYVRFRYPLIELGMNNDEVVGYFLKNELPMPSRSVCRACFANGLGTMQEMYNDHPADWSQAVAVDEAVRDWRQIGVDLPVYVSKTLIPLKDLPALDFRVGGVENADSYSCDSGYCFT